jgi:exopolyphosphatase / guanosine-5'-triphosphate,3'-diphosphate pyrophosphatase
MNSPFPVRLAAMDFGSNAIRFLIAEFSTADCYDVLHFRRIPLRLGHDVFLTGALSDHSIDVAAATLARFQRRLDQFQVDHYRAVATSAVRESSNGSALLARSREAGIVLEPISDGEEARLAWIAVSRRVDLGALTWVLGDLGGGSLEVSVIDRGGMKWTRSLPLGAVRLLEQFGPDPALSQLDNYIAQHARLEIPQSSKPPAGFIATGGNIEALARLIHPGVDESVACTIAAGSLETVAAQLAAHSLTERSTRFGLRGDRADVIVPAAAVYSWLARTTGFSEVIVPFVGIKEGILFDLVEQL